MWPVRFSYFIKDVSHTPASLMTELRRLDAYLVSSGHRYLCSDEHLTHLDCIMLPKLQHIRVAAHALRNFQIPAELGGLWRYLESAYQSDLFFKTCPADEEIVAHWLEKPECRAVVDEATLSSATHDRPPTYSFDVPHPSMAPWCSLYCLQCHWTALDMLLPLLLRSYQSLLECP